MEKLLWILICLLTASLTAQEAADADFAVLKAPENWRTELIKFPLSFAPDLDLRGMEDIRFAPGWADKNAEDFWNYAFVWYLNDNPKLTEEKLENYMETYFDGLMQVVGKSKEIEKTNSLFFGKADDPLQPDFIGKIRVYDAFFVKDIITLYTKVRIFFCVKTQKHMVFFRVAPKSFGDEVWKNLKEVSVGINCKK